MKVFNTLAILLVLLSCSSAVERKPASFSLSKSCAGVLTSFHDKYVKGLKYSQLNESELKPLYDREYSELEIKLRNNPIKEELLDIGRSSGSTKPEFLLLEENIKVVWKKHAKIKLSNYRAEVLAYELDLLWGMQLVPETVERRVDDAIGSMQLFKESITGPLLEYNIKNRMSDSAIERVRLSLKKQELFDFLINNNDRNKNNFLFTLEGDLYSIDNAASFTGQGYRARTFKDREDDILEFLSTDEGRNIFRNIESSYDDQFKEQMIDYLGTKDAQKLFDRIELILELNLS